MSHSQFDQTVPPREKKRKVALVGYSGHGLVACETLLAAGRELAGYFERQPRQDDPFRLEFLGLETDLSARDLLHSCDYFVALGCNKSRQRVQENLTTAYGPPINAIHPSASVATSATLGRGSLIGPQAAINAVAHIGDGAICNTACVVEHDCHLGRFAHLCPGAVMTGNTKVGELCLIGANSVLLPGVTVEARTVVGAGSVVLRDLGPNGCYAGNPCRPLRGTNMTAGFLKGSKNGE